MSVGQLREWAQSVIEHVQIENVRLKEIQSESPDVILSGPFDVKTVIQFKGMQYGEDRIEAAVYYVVTSHPKSNGEDEPQEAWRVQCELRATFGASGPEQPLPPFSQDQLDALAGVVGVIHVHPYARETVQNMTGRMGYPPFTLDLITPISGMPDDMLVDFADD